MKKRARPLGHDLVVAALLMLSCSNTIQNELARETVATLEQPTKVRLERANVEVTHTAGCGCTKGCIPFPTREGTRCRSETHHELQCELTVERDDGRASHATPCGTGGQADLQVDANGDRIATRGSGVWHVYTGGWQSTLIEGQDALRLPVSITGALDWNTVPSAREMVRRAIVDAFENEITGLIVNRDDSPKLFENLTHVSAAHLDEDFALLAPDDHRIAMCRKVSTPWTRAYAKQSLAIRADIQKLLAPKFESENHVELLHALFVLDPKALLAQAGEPSKYLETKTSSVTSAAVLDAWSRTAAARAGAYACKALGEKLAPDLEDAALAAVARAGLKCPAVAKLVPRHCPLPELHTLHWEHQPEPETAFCEPEKAFLEALLLVKPKLDDDQVRALCPSNDAAVKDASDE